MNEKNNDSNSQDDSFSDSTELFDDIFDDGKGVDQKPAPQKESPAQKPASPSPDKKTEKQAGSDSENGAFSDSMELFDDIFHEDTDVQKPASPSKKKPALPPKKIQQPPGPQKAPMMKKPQPPIPPAKKASPVKPQPSAPTPHKKSPAPPPKKIQQPPGPQKAPMMKKPQPPVTPAKKTSPVKPQPPAVTPDKIPAPPPLEKAQKVPEPRKGPPVLRPTEKAPTVTLDLSGAKTRSQGRAKKGVNTLVFISSIVVLVIASMLTGMILDYGDMLDPLKIMKYFEPDKKTTTGSKISSPVIKHEEPEIGISNIQSPAATTKATPSVTGDVPAEKVPVVKNIEEVSPTKDIPEDKASTTSATPPPPQSSLADNIDILKIETLSYPYSIYLGSYSTEASVKKAVSDYEEIGLSSYWIKLDLGDKGTWFRLFSGHFQKRAEADEFIKTRQIPGAESKNTKYANLIGIFTSREGLDIQKQELERLGYSPYVISDTPNMYRLYTGAFYQKERAEEQQAELSLRGIKNQVVER
jgi:hypothetical protein